MRQRPTGKVALLVFTPGQVTTKEEIMRQDDVLLDELIAPLRVRLSELDRLAVEKTAELKEIHAAQHRIRRTISFLAPEPVKPKTTKSQKMTAGPERTELVRVYLQQHAGAPQKASPPSTWNSRWR
jgi:hypothetical protein